MTTPTDTDVDDETPETAEVIKISPIGKKPTNFGGAGFQNGSKFGKGPSGSNPQLKQRPGRAAARGR